MWKRHNEGDSLRRSRGIHPPLRTGADPFSGALEVLGYGGLPLNANHLRVEIERALGGAPLGGGEAQVLGRSSEVAMSKQQLDGAHVGAGFQQMNCKCVPTMSLKT